MPSGETLPWDSQTRASTTAAATSSPAISSGMARRIPDVPGSHGAGEPQPRLLELGEPGERVGVGPHPCERRFVRELDDRVAETAPEVDVLAADVGTEQPREQRIELLVVAVPAHRLFDPRVRAEQPRADRRGDVIAVALDRADQGPDPVELQALLVVEDDPEHRVVLAAERGLQRL